MRIGISNIAWDITEDSLVADLLIKHEIDAVDIAPGKYFPDPSNVSDNTILKVKNFWFEKGIEITGMQSLLFGMESLNIFGPSNMQLKILSHMECLFSIARKLGATRLVFGSPKNRNRSGLSDNEAFDKAISFFWRLGEIASLYNVTLCLEPNPVVYNSNFMTTSKETLNIVKAINHPGIKMQLDTGAITLNNESLSEILPLISSEVGHIHISEPYLSVIGATDTNHKNLAKYLKKIFSNSLATIEMVATKQEVHLSSIERAVKFVTSNYRDNL